MKPREQIIQVKEPISPSLQGFLVPQIYSEPPEGTIQQAVTAILHQIGEDPTREGLLKTPERVARMLMELTSGYETDPIQLINGALFDVDYSEMVLVKDIEFYSLCEHHLLPFFGRVHVAYIPDGKVIGLSKIPRMVEMFARRLQVQERMTSQIADLLEEVLHPQGVGVVVEAAHLCAMMRGVKKSQATMVTRALRGVLRKDEGLRSEFLAQVNSNLQKN